MNNPLIFTDPSGYRPDLIFEEERRISAGQDFGGGGGGSWNPFGWIRNGTDYMQGYITSMSWSYSNGYHHNYHTGEGFFSSSDKIANATMSGIAGAYGRVKQVGSIGGVNGEGEAYVKPIWEFEYWDDGQVSMAIEFRKNVWLAESDHL